MITNLYDVVTIMHSEDAVIRARAHPCEDPIVIVRNTRKNELHFWGLKHIQKLTKFGMHVRSGEKFDKM